MQPRSHRWGRVAPVVVISSVLVAAGWATADAATVTASYSAGYRDVTINGYGTAGMGTFTLRDGTEDHVALCLEADVGHSTVSDAYSTSPNRVNSPELDALLWWLDRQPEVDDDTAVAAAALAWYDAQAVRTIGPLVWADAHRGFAPIGPLSPEPWDSLPRFSLNHMVGLVAGGVHLDAAERRVVQLQRLATRLAGPWTLTSDADTGAFRLVGRNGPIAGESISITIEPTDGPVTNRSVTTDESGMAAVDLPHLADGAVVRAAAVAPGIHREWDGAGAVQRMATPVSVTLTAELSVAPLPRHVRVVKRAADPTIGVAGAVFELHDSAGRVVETATSDATGRADFPPIDPASSPAPYEVIETTAPPGLVADSTRRRITDASTNAGDPTVVEVVNEPATVQVSVQKRLSIPEVGPGDLSGFRFVATRREDGGGHELTTHADGTTDPISLAIGTYDICETGTPAWAAGLTDGGCAELVVDVAALTSTHPRVLEYTNVVPDHTVDTNAFDRADGDRSLPSAGGMVVDEVRLTGLVPHTTYTLIGEVIGAGDDPEPTGIVAEATFTATSPEQTIELEFELSKRRPGTVVIVERLLIGGRIVAVHDDLTDPEQTITIVAAATTTTSTAPTTPTTAPPPPETTSTAPATTTTTTTTIEAASTAPATTTAVTTPPTLPPTGPADATGWFLRLGDIGFLVGVGLVVLAGLTPRRVDGETRRGGAPEGTPPRRSSQS